MGDLQLARPRAFSLAFPILPPSLGFKSLCLSPVVTVSDGDGTAEDEIEALA